MCAFFSVIAPLNLLSLLAEMFCKGLHQGRFGKVIGQNLSRPALVLVVDVSSSLFDFLKILLSTSKMVAFHGKIARIQVRVS